MVVERQCKGVRGAAVISEVSTLLTATLYASEMNKRLGLTWLTHTDPWKITNSIPELQGASATTHYFQVWSDRLRGSWSSSLTAASLSCTTLNRPLSQLPPYSPNSEFILCAI